MENMPYQFQPYEPGAIVELYLPKKAEYQGILYDTLTQGFDLERVKAHFRDPTRRLAIQRLLEHYGEVTNIEERIDQLEQFYWGYSMYEVDGVFYSAKKGIIEERTQIVRMMFLPDMRKVHSLAPSMEYSDLRRLVTKAIRSDKEVRDNMRKRHPEVADYASNWIGDLGLFLFGYIVFQFCAKVRELSKEDENRLEEEIWLASFWDIEINRVKLTLPSEVDPGSRR